MNTKEIKLLINELPIEEIEDIDEFCEALAESIRKGVCKICLRKNKKKGYKK